MDSKRLLSGFLMAITMSFCMSLVMTLVNVGPTSAFPFLWMRGWFIGFCVAFPLSMFLPKYIQKISGKILKNKN
ncbi:hypothetical protein MmiEs2_13970 [Methanimicrococcus stummii]|uniref:DUF2798 domain-containing protein n=1 Tax=Methanimicrococcus stummii TaxID=3028294 RepID=A0AA96V9R2_9EURY|nr:hypothetical protein MmiEs2_13970 [Methanimicrococcus sp. Es2]